MVVLLPLLVAIAGLLLYVLSNHPKWSTVGLWAYGAGLLVFLLQGAGQVVTLLNG